jgi:hypothetical protein
LASESEQQMRATCTTPEIPFMARCPRRLHGRRHKKPQAEIRDVAQGLLDHEAAEHRTCPHIGQAPRARSLGPRRCSPAVQLRKSATVLQLRRAGRSRCVMGDTTSPCGLHPIATQQGKARSETKLKRARS